MQEGARTGCWRGDPGGGAPSNTPRNPAAWTYRSRNCFPSLQLTTNSGNCGFKSLMITLQSSSNPRSNVPAPILHYSNNGNSAAMRFAEDCSESTSSEQTSANIGISYKRCARPFEPLLPLLQAGDRLGCPFFSHVCCCGSGGSRALSHGWVLPVFEFLSARLVTKGTRICPQRIRRPPDALPVFRM